MNPIDRQILEFLGRYRVAERSTLGLFAYGGEELNGALKRLMHEGLVTHCRGLPGNRSMYQLAKKGAAKIGVSEARARSFQTQAIFKHLGILSFCHVAGTRRFRLEDDELQTLLGQDVPDGAHCMATNDSTPLLLNVYVPGPRTSLRSVQRHLREQLAEVRKLPAVRALLDQRTFGFAVVTETPERRKAILSLLRQPERDGKPPLAKQVRIWVEALPEFDRLINGAVREFAKPHRSAGESPRESVRSAASPARKRKKSRRSKPVADMAPLFQEIDKTTENEG